MRPSKNRKLKAYYLSVMLLVLGFIVPVTIPGTLSAYIAFVSALGSITTLFWGSNVAQKAMTKDVYLKELERQQGGES